MRPEEFSARAHDIPTFCTFQRNEMAGRVSDVRQTTATSQNTISLFSGHKTREEGHSSRLRCGSLLIQGSSNNNNKETTTQVAAKMDGDGERGGKAEIYSPKTSRLITANVAARPVG